MIQSPRAKFFFGRDYSRHPPSVSFRSGCPSRAPLPPSAIVCLSPSCSKTAQYCRMLPRFMYSFFLSSLSRRVLQDPSFSSSSHRFDGVVYRFLFLSSNLPQPFFHYFSFFSATYITAAFTIRGFFRCLSNQLFFLAQCKSHPFPFATPHLDFSSHSLLFLDLTSSYLAVVPFRSHVSIFFPLSRYYHFSLSNNIPRFCFSFTFTFLGLCSHCLDLTLFSPFSLPYPLFPLAPFFFALVSLSPFSHPFISHPSLSFFFVNFLLLYFLIGHSLSLHTFPLLPC